MNFNKTEVLQAILALNIFVFGMLGDIIFLMHHFAVIPDVHLNLIFGVTMRVIPTCIFTMLFVDKEKWSYNHKYNPLLNLVYGCLAGGLTYLSYTLAKHIIGF